MSHSKYLRSLAIHPVLIGDFNWDIVADSSLTQCYSIAKTNECADSIYGDKYHLKHLLDLGFIAWDKFTDKGIELMSGAYCRKMQPDNGKPFILTSFN